jgi:hypothetical protein
MKRAGPCSGQQRQHEELRKQGKPIPGLQYRSTQGTPTSADADKGGECLDSTAKRVILAALEALTAQRTASRERNPQCEVSLYV